MPDATTPPRIFGIPARRAAIVAVLRRGPTDWCHVGRWDVANEIYEPGAWFRGTIYPQKCDVSPDGRWLAYSAMKQGADWAAGSIYEAVSRLPWLTALAAWNAGSTYTRGVHFTDVTGQIELGPPDVGDAGPLLRRYGLVPTLPEQFAVERRGGWHEAAQSEPRADGGQWDDRRIVIMERTRPGGDDVLRVQGGYAAFRTMPDWYAPAGYTIADSERTIPLPDVQWADWDGQGRLLVATSGGSLQIRSLIDDEWIPIFDEDLSGLRPEPTPPPAWASEW